MRTTPILPRPKKTATKGHARFSRRCAAFWSACFARPMLATQPAEELLRSSEHEKHSGFSEFLSFHKDFTKL